MKNVFTLVGVITVALLMSSAWAQTSQDDYVTTNQGKLPELGVVLKSERRDCPTGTKFFKNEFPSLTNGQGAGNKTEIYSIDNVDVIMTVEWSGNNDFEFSIFNGVAHKVGVNIDTINLLYNYEMAPVSGDAPLNKLTNNQPAADVNHLDLCLAVAVLDTEPPDVTIDAPQPGVTVSGTVTVMATITDNVDVSSGSVMASVNDGVGDVSLGIGTPIGSDQYQWSWDTTALEGAAQTVTVSASDPSGNIGTANANVFLDTEAPEVMINAPEEGDRVSDTVTVMATITDNVQVNSAEASVNGVSLGVLSTSPYQWSWDTTTFSTGAQTITVSATDTSGNIGMATVDVTVVFSLASCEGVLGDDDPAQGEGCNPSGVQNVQVPPDNNSEGCISNNPPEPCTITEFLLTPDIPPTTGFYPGVPATCTGPNVFPDPRVDNQGFPQQFRPLHVFTELGGAPDSAPGFELVLDEFTFGNPCFAVVFGEKNFGLTAAFFWPVDPVTGLVIIRTQFEDLIPGIGPETECYDEMDNPDLQEAGEFTYQTDSLSRMIAGTAEVVTNKCFNPKRGSTRDFSFNVLNTKEHGGIVFSSATGPDDVLEFKFQRADAKFDALEIALDLAAPLLVSPKYSVLTRKFNQARSQFNKKNSGALGRAQADLEDLLFEVKNGTWDLTDDNFPGDVQMRNENLIHRVMLLKRALENPNFPVQ